MGKHSFRVGQTVIFEPTQGSIGPSIYVVQRLLPRENNRFLYRIKSREGGIERIANELELESLN